jgi:hypothetical protein
MIDKTVSTPDDMPQPEVPQGPRNRAERRAQFKKMPRSVKMAWRNRTKKGENP